VSVIAKPFLFNPLKHHLGYILEFIQHYGNTISLLKSDLSIIGNSQMDVYCGTLSLEDIKNEIYEYLCNCISINNISYIKLINEYNGYLIIALSDDSNWVLRKGNGRDRYIHFHPARVGAHTFRITANALKTWIAASIIGKNSIELKEINQARVHILGLAPIEKLYPNRGLGKFISHFRQAI
jgi:hypothetical protein